MHRWSSWWRSGFGGCAVGALALPGRERAEHPVVRGFPGFVSKLWLAHDGNGVYRGFSSGTAPQLADAYVRALWWVLTLVSVHGSIHYVVIPGLRRDDVLEDPTLLDRRRPGHGMRGGGSSRWNSRRDEGTQPVKVGAMTTGGVNVFTTVTTTKFPASVKCTANTSGVR